MSTWALDWSNWVPNPFGLTNLPVAATVLCLFFFTSAWFTQWHETKTHGLYTHLMMTRQWTGKRALISFYIAIIVLIATAVRVFQQAQIALFNMSIYIVIVGGAFIGQFIHGFTLSQEHNIHNHILHQLHHRKRQRVGLIAALDAWQKHRAMGSSDGDIERAVRKAVEPFEYHQPKGCCSWLRPPVSNPNVVFEDEAGWDESSSPMTPSAAYRVVGAG